MADVKTAANGDVDGDSHDLKSILSAEGRDYLVRNNGGQVKISDLDGKIVAMYFSASWCGPCLEFAPNFTEVYGELSEKGDFEAIYISGDEDEESFNSYFCKMPWLAIPFSDSSTRDRLNDLFQVNGIPHLVILDREGKVLSEDGVSIIREYGADAYPFTVEKLNELKEEEEAAKKNQTLSSILVSHSRDFVISNDGNKVPVADLVGKHVLLYFSAQWCPPCRAFLPKLKTAYHEIKAKDTAFEVVFISSDSDQASFDEFFEEMPWLAVPFGDERKTSLSRTFKIRGIPSLIAIGPTGKTITKEARGLVMVHGSLAYPFTEEHLKAMEAQIEEMAKGWPEKLSHPLHAEHELTLTRRKEYICDSCEEGELNWSYFCEQCDFDIHPQCALKDDDKKEGGDVVGHADDSHVGGGDEVKEQPSKDGLVCDGEICRKP